MAEYFHERLIEELKKSPHKRFDVVDQSGPGVVVMEIAFTELEFSHPIARAGSLLSPMPGTAEALNTIANPHVAFAARFTGGANDTLVATIAERKFPPTRIIDLNKLTVSSSVREICSIWAKSLAEAIEGGRLVKVREKWLSILPW